MREGGKEVREGGKEAREGYKDFNVLCVLLLSGHCL